MRFPSLHSLAGGAWRTFLRFPIAVLLAMKATGFGLWWTHLAERRGQYGGLGSNPAVIPHWYWNVIVSCWLGMLLSVAVTKWVEKRRGRAGADRRPAIGLQAGVLVLTALYFWSLPAEFSSQMVIRSLALALGLHGLIAVMGFGRDEVNGFWLFNKRLFLRFLTTYLYSAVLYIGVLLALLAVDKLFNADFSFEVYADCWWVFGGLFAVWFFLAGFPESYENPEVISDYPRGLKIFTQYVLLSLVTIYMLILYAYMIKIILTRHWPVGWVAWMIMAYSVAGILSLLLIYPLQKEKSHIWIRSYTRIFYQALLPLIILLFTAIYKRVSPYGITEQRYFLLALAWWLLFLTLYFLVSRKKDIRLVPLSLCVLAFLSVWGPWGAFSVSMHSQRNRLAGLLEKYGLLVNGKAVTDKTDVRVSLKDRKEISSEMDYLLSEHGTKSLQPWFGGRNLDSVSVDNGEPFGVVQYQESAPVMRLLHVHYASQWEDDTSSVAQASVMFRQSFVSLPGPYVPVVATDGAADAAMFSLEITDSDTCRSLVFGQDRLNICADTARKQLRFSLSSGDAVSVAYLAPLIRSVLAQSGLEYDMRADEASLPLTGGALSGKVVLTHLRGLKSDSAVELRHIEGMVLFSRK